MRDAKLQDAAMRGGTAAAGFGPEWPAHFRRERRPVEVRE